MALLSEDETDETLAAFGDVLASICGERSERAIARQAGLRCGNEMGKGQGNGSRATGVVQRNLSIVVKDSDLTDDALFEVIGRRSRKVVVGDVFIWKLKDRPTMVGHVLHDSVDIGFGPQLLVAFFDLPETAYTPGEIQLAPSSLIDRPFVTYSLGWRDGCFVRIDTGRPSQLGDIGFEVGYLGKIIDVEGSPVDRQACDLVVLGMYSTFQGIARPLYRSNPSLLPWSGEVDRVITVVQHD